MKPAFLIGAAVVGLSLTFLRAADSEEGFTPIFDGKTFAGWKTSIDNTNTWKIEEGAFVTRGSVAHVFYVGDTNPFKNFELKVDVMTERSEEHTSELQSLRHLVCRLLLEKKK